MLDDDLESYLEIIEDEAAAQDIELDVELAVEFAEELFLNELEEEDFDELVERIEESGRFEPTLGPDDVKPTFGPEIIDREGEEELVDEPDQAGLDELPDPGEGLGF